MLCERHALPQLVCACYGLSSSPEESRCLPVRLGMLIEAFPSQGMWHQIACARWHQGVSRHILTPGI